MTRPSPHLPIRGLALICVLALAGCGVGSQSSDTEPPPADTQPADAQPADTQPADTSTPAADTAPADTATADTAPADTATADTAPPDTATTGTEPAATEAPTTTVDPLADAIDIEATVEASRNEGKLVVYGNPSADQWTPVLEAFNEAYPWIEVETFDLGGAEAFQRYLSEEATGSPTADVIVNTDGAGWLDLVSRGKVLDYVDPELAEMSAEDAVLAPGVYAMSYDPLIAVFNTLALPLDEQPTSLAEMAAMAPELDGRLGTTDITNAQAALGTYGYVDRYGDEAWANLEALGPHSGVEDSNGVILGKLQAGEYVASYFTSGSLRALIDMTETGDLLNYRYLSDAATLPARGMAVTSAAASPSSAQLLVNFLLSAEGQAAACNGGFTPYRDDVDCPTGLSAVEEAVGAENVIMVDYPEDLLTAQPAIQERWNAAFGR